MRVVSWGWLAGCAAAALVAAVATALLVQHFGPDPVEPLDERPSSTVVASVTAETADSPSVTTTERSSPVATDSSPAPTTKEASSSVPASTTPREPGVEFVSGAAPDEGSGAGTVAEGDDVYVAVDSLDASVGPVGGGLVRSVDGPEVDVVDGPDVLGSEGTTTPTAGGAGRDLGPVGEGEEYTWEDGDATRRVWLQADLVVREGGEVGVSGEVVAETAAGSIVRGGDGLPVFRSGSGALMTLPGGVLVVLRDEWTEAETDAFFVANGIGLGRVSELAWLENGFFVETDPGFPSLELANRLAPLEGVVLSSPNWATETSTR